MILSAPPLQAYLFINNTQEPSVPSDNMIIDGIYTVGNDSVKINGTLLDRTSDTYTKMFSYLSNKGFNTIINAYEFTLLSGNISDGVNITFEIDQKYNDRKTLVLHLKNNGEYEEF